ncbi:MAG: ATP-binding protein, partial [Conexibacteraceae bacterium]|nr:ATP-binding protein [Conexibacteraceae bacterium]
ACVLSRPLSQTAADQRLFVDREQECAAVLRVIEAGQPVLLLGERGSGRTSLLNRVAWQLARSTEQHVVMMSGETVEDPAQFFGVLIARLHRLSPSGGRAAWIQELQALSLPDGPFGKVAKPAIVMELIDLLGDRLAKAELPVRVLIDGMSPTVAHGVFGTLRNELWALDGVSWVLAGDSSARALYLEPPADAFFESVVELAPLADADAARLVRAHVTTLDASGIERAVTAGRGNPRSLLRAAVEIEAGADPAEDTREEPAELAVELAGATAGALVGYMAANGPTSASDDLMLRTVGISRQRASQLLRTLETAGLLETVTAKSSSGPGRPPRRFAIRTGR